MIIYYLLKSCEVRKSLLYKGELWYKGWRGSINKGSISTAEHNVVNNEATQRVATYHQPSPVYQPSVLPASIIWKATNTEQIIPSGGICVEVRGLARHTCYENGACMACVNDLRDEKINKLNLVRRNFISIDNKQTFNKVFEHFTDKNLEVIKRCYRIGKKKSLTNYYSVKII